eukprot:TRINITY_DN1547_c0_g2_i1.p3 TRINITY_DN1547_c0_g2~~TRINITY_DN1547_c0_g2_i1.p3  ORF type:complete len:132 (+),score=6.34 TRINITY_DN1547_c0_g2_i1:627-1022(+)
MTDRCTTMTETGEVIGAVRPPHDTEVVIVTGLLIMVHTAEAGVMEGGGMEGGMEAAIETTTATVGVAEVTEAGGNGDYVFPFLEIHSCSVYSHIAFPFLNYQCCPSSMRQHHRLANHLAQVQDLPKYGDSV